MEPKFQAHIAGELKEQIEQDQKRQKDRYPSLENYMRLRSVSQFGQWYQDYATFRNNGYRVKLASGEWRELPMDVETSFDFFTATEATTKETTEFELVYSEKTAEMVLEVATYRNALARLLNEINGNSAEVVYPTAGQWFKEVVFVHSFPIDAKLWLNEQLEPFEKAKPSRKEKMVATA